MTNLTNLEIDKPEGYSEQAVDDILDNVAESQKFSTGPHVLRAVIAATTPKEEQAKQPTIIYVMDESYWDVSELEQYGITFDTDVSQEPPRFAADKRLRQGIQPQLWRRHL